MALAWLLGGGWIRWRLPTCSVLLVVYCLSCSTLLPSLLPSRPPRSSLSINPLSPSSPGCSFFRRSIQFIPTIVYYPISSSVLHFIRREKAHLARMRYEHWDVLLFPENSKIPVQEFKTQCFVTKDRGESSPTTLHIPTDSILMPIRIPLPPEPPCHQPRSVFPGPRQLGPVAGPHHLRAKFASQHSFPSVYPLLGETSSQPLYGESDAAR